MTKLTGIEKLHPQNHDLYRRVQHLVGLRWSWEAIADDAGLVGARRVQDLCEWVLEYREPKKLPMVSSLVLEVPTYSPALRDRGVRLAMWERQRAGAMKARAQI
jgi:hypothetical protein